jgi:hypothetical protein
MVHITQTYPGMKPYLKGFHLYLETWQGGRDKEGWKVPAKTMLAGVIKKNYPAAMNNVKLLLLTQTTAGWDVFAPGPLAGFTLSAPQFREDLKVMLSLAEGEQPASAASGASVPTRPSTALVMRPPWDLVQLSSNPMECMAALACWQGMRRDLALTIGSCKVW